MIRRGNAHAPGLWDRLAAFRKVRDEMREHIEQELVNKK